ncbi:unnamed protein product [Mycena citricolor]|uniref:Uncharacterized protein n=1 Tax=Mycena citricolor TaxID=2018698 RepID=A0AAD2H089_9AGAR|nr:unnamed protein product [Mycena citricolor]
MPLSPPTALSATQEATAKAAIDALEAIRVRPFDNSSLSPLVQHETRSGRAWSCFGWLGNKSHMDVTSSSTRPCCSGSSFSVIGS